MFLKVENLYKSFGKNSVLKNINFGADKGEILCLLGPSGCGKTTLLNSLGGFVKIDCGQIFLDKKDISNMESNERHISTVFQSYGLFSHMNVFENISYGLKFKKISKEEKNARTFEMIDIVGLTNLHNRKISEISGGQQQRVALARSLIINPKLLLLDEPFSNLDKNLKVLMREEIKKLVNYFEMTTILVTHDQEDAFSVADRVILMNEGEIVQNSSPEDLYNRPNSIFSLEFIGKSNKMDKSFIRPEKININSKSGEEAIIRRIIFHGSLIDYEVELVKDNVIILVSEVNSGFTRNVGDKIYLEYRLENIDFN